MEELKILLKKIQDDKKRVLELYQNIEPTLENMHSLLEILSFIENANIQYTWCDIEKWVQVHMNISVEIDEEAFLNILKVKFEGLEIECNDGSTNGQLYTYAFTHLVGED